MAKKKLTGADLREQTLEELQLRLDETKEQLFKLRVRATTRELSNSSEIRRRKRDVARILTVMNQKRAAANR